MNIGIGSLIGYLLGVAPVSIAIWEAFNNRSKLRLSLYEKRLDIFKNAHHLHITLLRRKGENIDSALDEFTKKYRAAKFLFDPEDEVLELFKKFRQEAWNVADLQDRNKVKPDFELTEKITAAQHGMEEILMELEKKIQPYLQAPRHYIWRHTLTLTKDFYKNHFKKLTEKYTD